MSEHTLVESDVHYLSFYLMEKDQITGSISYYDLSNVTSLVFRMKKYGSSTAALEATMEVSNATLGYCRVLATIPSHGDYYTEIEVRESSQRLTWIGPVFHVVREIG